jgi:hypothetical protein
VRRMQQSVPGGASFDDCVFGSCLLTLADYAQAVRHEPRTRRLVRVATWFGSVLCAIGALMLALPRTRMGLAVFAVGTLCFAAHNAPDRVAERWFAKLPRTARQVRVTVGPNGLIIASDAACELHSWASLVGYHAAPDVFLVWTTHKHFLVLPKRAFAAGDRDRVTNEFETRLGAPPALPRFWLWLGTAVLLGALALALWNRLSPR